MLIPCKSNSKPNKHLYYCHYLSTWLLTINSNLGNKERPHKSLNYLTPFAFEKKTNFSAANRGENDRMICHNLQDKRASTTPLNG
jgi:hypothetical protein